MHEVAVGGGRQHAVGAEVLRTMDIESALARAIRNQALDVHYQPIVSLADGEILAAEAPVRWSEPVLGEIAPNEFIPLAETSHLINELGRFVLAEAIAQLARWRAVNAALLPDGIFVNVSPRELDDPSFVPFVEERLAQSGIAPSDLALELTERILDDHDVIADTIAALIQLGVRLSLDDFGMGSSSLSAIRTFPLHSVKIDHAPIRAITNTDSEALIARAVISLGHALGMRVIAEGVEHDVQLDYLRRLGCDAAQGFLLARPLPAAEVTRLLTLRHEATTGRAMRVRAGAELVEFTLDRQPRSAESAQWRAVSAIPTPSAPKHVPTAAVSSATRKPM